jgi:cyclopropane-fatty-acyl-phospholipid synthase
MVEFQESIIGLINNPKVNLFLDKFNKIVEWTKNKIEAIRDPENYIKSLLSSVWITVWWTNLWDIQVNDPTFYKRVIFWWTLSLWESYMDWSWDCDNLDVFFEKILDWWLEWSNSWITDLILDIKAVLGNMQNRKKSRKVIDEHYNIWNEVYKLFLDDLMLYTCWYYKNWTETLENSQKNKLDLIAEKLELKPWMKVLDMWCWWWGAAKYISEKYNVEITWITISEEQISHAKKYYQSDNVLVKFMDYRDLWGEKFDAIYVMGMTEHIWYKNYVKFTKKVEKSLKNWWKFLWHTIWSNKTMKHNNAWFNKYIFHNWLAPSQKQISESIEKTDLILEDSHNFWPDYSPTLREWYNRFRKWYSKLSEKNPEKYDESFYRMFKYYLLSCEWAFRWRHVQLYQNLYSKWNKEKYTWVR